MAKVIQAAKGLLEKAGKTRLGKQVKKIPAPKRKVKQQAGEYFPTFIKAGKAVGKMMKKNFQTPAQRMGVIEFAVATPDRSKVKDAGGRWADHYKVATGMQDAFHTDGSKAKVGMADPAVLKSLYRKANVVNKWSGRGGGLAKDTADVVMGKPRARDASGRKKKREWEKSWAKDAVKKALLVGGGVAYGIAYKKSPKVRVAHDRVVKVAKKTGDDIKDAISNFETPARRLGIVFFAKRKEESDTGALRAGMVGGAIGGVNGAAAGGISTAHSKAADDYFGLVKRRENTQSRGGVMVLRKGEVKPFKGKGKFGSGERLARAEHESLKRLKKTAVKRSAMGGAAGAAVLGGLSYAAAKVAAGGKKGDARRETRGRGEKKRFHTPASRMIIELDAVAADAGWDVRDPRGRSARVFAPGSRRRVRREKTWGEQVENERKLWKAGVVGAGLAAGAAGIAVGRRLPKKPAGAAKSGLLVKTLKKKRDGQG